MTSEGDAAATGSRTALGGGDGVGLVRWLPDVSRAVVEAAGPYLAANQSEVGVVVRDARGEIVGANEAAQQLVDRTWDELIAPVAEISSSLLVGETGEAIPADRAPTMLALARGQVVLAACVGVLGDPDDPIRWLELSAFPLFAPPLPGLRPAACGVVGLLTDVSETSRGRLALESLVRRFRVLAERSADIVLRTDVIGRCDWVTPDVQRQTGWPPAELIGQDLVTLVHPEDMERVNRGSLVALRRAAEQRYDARARRRDGSYRWWSVVVRPDTDRDAQVRGLVITLHDAEHTMQALAQHAASERRFEQLAENSADVVAHVRSGRCVWVSSASEAVLGVRAADLVGHDVARLVLPEDRHVTNQAMIELAAGRASRQTVRSVAADGTTRWFQLVSRPLANEDPLERGGVVRLHDVTDEVSRRHLLEYRSRHDELTGLVNRQVLIERMASATARTDPRPGHQLVVGFCDLDRFKLLNDEHGHDGGDIVLRAMAGRITSMLRSTDTVARLGGDEIVLLLDDVGDVAEGFDVLDKVRRELREPIRVATGEVRVTVSIGLAVVAANEAPEDALRRADLAVYRAKYLGRDRVEVAADDLSDSDTDGRHRAPDGLDT